MRAIFVAACLGLGAVPHASADLSTIAQRAAYCSGVLQYRIDTFIPTAPDAPDNACLGWWRKDFPSIEACTTALDGNMIKEFEGKLKRYDDYLRSELARTIIANRENDQAKRAALFGVAIIKRKGSSDAEALKAAPVTPHVQQCEKKCDTDFKCLVDCVAERQPTDASVLRCALLPDELPY